MRLARRRFLRLAVPLAAGLGAGCATLRPAARAPAPRIEGRRAVRETIVIDSPGVYDFRSVLHIWDGAGWPADREYGPPILHVRAPGVTVVNFAFAGAPDGVHVGALPWDGRNAIRRGAPVYDVVFENLQATEIREDAFTCQTNTSRITLTGCHFWGGADKAVQNDHATDLVLHRCGFYDGTRSIRFKARTSGSVIGCRFVRCDYPIKADSQPWPSAASPRRRRPGGPVVLTVGDNVFSDAITAVTIDSGVRLLMADNRFPGTARQVAGDAYPRDLTG